MSKGSLVLFPTPEEREETERQRAKDFLNRFIAEHPGALQALLHLLLVRSEPTR